MKPWKNAVGAARVVAVLIGLSTGAIVGGGGVARGALPPAPPVVGASAILLDGAFGCSVGDAWYDLNSNWSKYGSVPISITTGGHLCDGKFALKDLEASGSDTVILDGTSFGYTLTPDQIQALRTYVEEGHTLLGTDTVFQWKTKHSNNGLAPLFGLAEQPSWYINGLGGKSPAYKLQEQDPLAAALLHRVSNPYLSSLYGRGQKPANKRWVAENLAGARYLGQTHHRANAISVYDSRSYTAIYISSQAAFQSTPDDMQFLYNAVVYPIKD